MVSISEDENALALKMWRTIFSACDATPKTHNIIMPMSIKHKLLPPPTDYQGSVYFDALVEGQIYCIEKSSFMPDMMENV